MARPRKPTALLELNGAFKTHPERKAARANEPQPTGELGNAPSFLTKEEKKIWREIRKSYFWLTECDRIVVTIVCKLTAKLNNGTMKAMEHNALLSALSRIGGTSVDRSKINTPAKPKPQEDSWSDFLTGTDERATQ